MFERSELVFPPECQSSHLGTRPTGGQWLCGRLSLLPFFGEQRKGAAAGPPPACIHGAATVSSNDDRTAQLPEARPAKMILAAPSVKAVTMVEVTLQRVFVIFHSP